jgi:hypothetical protein
MPDSRARTAELRSASGFFRGLRSFLADERPASSETRQRLARQTAEKEHAFERLLARAVFRHASSPYRRLFEWAGVSHSDVAALLARDGLTATLEQLHDAGVHLTLEEFKGLRPIVRPGLHVPVGAGDLDNPLNVRQYEAETGGSTGAARSVLVDLDLLECETAYHALFYSARGLDRRPVGIWHVAPPGAVGLKTALIQARLGRPAERWFSQRRAQDAPLKHSVFARATVLAARFCGTRVPTPEYTPAEEALKVVEWLATVRKRGEPAVLVTTPSAAVRTCAAAVDSGTDITDTFFVLVGEPFTTAKAAVVAAAGCKAASHYAMSEVGLIGLACASSPHVDDVHLLGEKVATIERPVSVSDTTISALYHTTVLPAAPKIMINVESGDFGVRERRRCDCGALPESCDHLHTIRSYEKLTSEGMHLVGGDLMGLVDDVLPSRFGGRPTDYQFLEGEERGLPRITLVIRSEVGTVDPRQVTDVVFQFLRERGTGQRLMADVWAQSRTLRVVRADPYVTPGGKIPPLRALAD